MSKWIRVDPDEFERIDDEVRGVELNVLISPYDIPEKVRGGYDEEHEHFVIEFDYILDEDAESQEVGDHIRARIGKHSGRILGFEIDVDALEAQRVQLNLGAPERMVEEAIDRVSQRNERQKNYEITRRILEGNREELFRDLSVA